MGGVVGAGLALAGSAVQAKGVEDAGSARARADLFKAQGDVSSAQAAAYQAQVARNNAAIAAENVGWTERAGAAKETAMGMRTRAAVGAIRAGQGASGIDTNTGSSAAVSTAAAKIGALDALTLRSNAAREAYGYEVKGVSENAQAGLLDRQSAQNYKAAQFDQDTAPIDINAGDTAALGTLLTGASSASSKFASWGATQPGSS